MIRVFVGCACNHEDLESQAVLEYSIRKHASEPVEITWMQLSHDPASPWSGWRTENWATPFSGFRWAIPEVCGFEGRAIYTDSDVMYMADIAELWNQKFKPGKSIMAKGGGSWRLCVSLWDCAGGPFMPLSRLKTDPDAHAQLCGEVPRWPIIQPFEGNWNCLDGEHYTSLDDPAIKAIHYTDMSTQPQLRHALKRLAADGSKHWFNGKVKMHARRDLIALFDDMLEEAKANGYTPEKYATQPKFGDFRKRSLVGYQGRAA